MMLSHFMWQLLYTNKRLTDGCIRLDQRQMVCLASATCLCWPDVTARLAAPGTGSALYSVLGFTHPWAWKAERFTCQCGMSIWTLLKSWHNIFIWSQSFFTHEQGGQLSQQQFRLKAVFMNYCRRPALFMSYWKVLRKWPGWQIYEQSTTSYKLLGIKNTLRRDSVNCKIAKTLVTTTTKLTLMLCSG